MDEQSRDVGFATLNSDISRIGSQIQSHVGDAMRGIMDEFQRTINHFANFFNNDEDFANGNQKIFYSNGVRLIHVTTNAKISDGTKDYTIQTMGVPSREKDFLNQNDDDDWAITNCGPFGEYRFDNNYRAPLIFYTMVAILLLIMSGFLAILYNRRRQLRQLRLLQQRHQFAEFDNREEFRADGYKPVEHDTEKAGMDDKPPSYERLTENDTFLPNYEEVTKKSAEKPAEIV